MQNTHYWVFFYASVCSSFDEVFRVTVAVTISKLSNLDIGYKRTQ